MYKKYNGEGPHTLQEEGYGKYGSLEHALESTKHMAELPLKILLKNK